MKSRAFTLVELLAVVAVIGMLAAFLLPALGKTKEAERIDCANNLRQINLAAQMYIDDPEDFLPLITARVPMFAHSFAPSRLLRIDREEYRYGKGGWHRLLRSEYLDKNTNIFPCAGNQPQLQRRVRKKRQKESKELSSTFNFCLCNQSPCDEL